MKEFAKYTGAVMMLVGVAILVIPFFMGSTTNTNLIIGLVLVVEGLLGHIYVNNMKRGNFVTNSRSRRPVRGDGQRVIRNFFVSKRTIREGQRGTGFPDYRHDVFGHRRGAKADQGNATGHLPAFGNIGQDAGGRVSARYGRWALAGRVLGLGGSRSPLVRGWAAVSACPGARDAKGMRGEPVDHGRDPGVTRRKGGRDLRVNRRRGSGG